MVWTIGRYADMAVPSANIGRSGVVSAAMMRFRGWCRRKIIFLLIPIRRDIPRIAGTARHPPPADKKFDDGKEEGRRPRRRIRRHDPIGLAFIRATNRWPDRRFAFLCSAAERRRANRRPPVRPPVRRPDIPGSNRVVAPELTAPTPPFLVVVDAHTCWESAGARGG